MSLTLKPILRDRRKLPSIGIVVPSFDRGGLEQVALNLYRGYRERGWQVVVLIENNIAGTMLGRLANPSDAIILNREEGLFIKALAERRIDALHYHYSGFGLRLARQLGITSIYTLHNAYTWLEDGPFAHHAGVVLEADRVVAVSRFVRDYFVTRAGCDPDRVDVVPNGVDLSWIDGGSGAPAIDVPEDQFVFAMPASFHPVKHHALAIRAIERVAERRRDVHLVLLGNVGEEDYAAEIERLIDRSPARDHITKLDYVPHVAMAAFYRDLADCVVLPTLQEGCSNVVLEALAMDRPMILTDVGNAAEAAAMSPRVRVIEPARPITELGPDAIAQLSRTGDTSNLRALIGGMTAALSARGGAASEAELAERRRRICLDTMVDAYCRLIEPGLWPALSPQTSIAPSAALSNTADALA